MAHEDLNREEDVQGSSDRAFGFVFGSVFLIVAGWPLLHGGAPRWWAMGVAAAFALVALVRPAVLAAPNRWWLKLGLLLGRILSPIAMGVVFYGVITPIGLLMRALGKDPLKLKLDRATPSYWCRREPPGPAMGSLNQQF